MRIRIFQYPIIYLALFMVGLGSAACGVPGIASPTRPKPVDHIYVIVMENEDYGSIIGDSKAPYLNSLAMRYGLVTNYTAVAHPSQPNYFALFSGSTQGITDDRIHDVSGTSLVDQLEAHRLTWKVYAENMPPNCYTSATASGGVDGPGDYVRRHNPAISITNIRSSPVRCSHIVDFTQFDPAAANFEFIVPNLCNDMHDCPVETGDAFLSRFVPKILSSAAWQQGGLLFIVWDEGTDNTGGGGRVPLLVISDHMTSGIQSPTPHNHYSLVRTIQDIWGLGCLAETCSANGIEEFFK